MADLTRLLKPEYPIGEREKLCRECKDRCGGIIIVNWLVTFRCNLRCRHCYVPSPRRSQELSTEESVCFIHHLGELGVPWIFLSGGEPLLRKDIEVILREVREAGMRVLLSINGTLVTPKVASLIKDLFKETKQLYVGVSLYGPKELHDTITQVEGTFDKVMEGIKSLTDYGIPMYVKNVVSGTTYPYIPQIMDCSISSGIRAFYTIDLVPLGKGSGALGGRVGKKQWSVLLDRIVSYIETENVYVDIDAAPSAIPLIIEKIEATNPNEANLIKGRVRQRQCAVDEGYVSVLPDGSVLACNFMPDLIFGNIREKPIEEIAGSFGEFFDTVGEPCASCKWNNICGGCRAKALYMLGDARKGDPTCLLYEKA